MKGSAALLTAAMIAALSAAARAEAPPVRLDYRATEGCPAKEALVEEIAWRTSLLRLAQPGEPAMLVEARIDRRGKLHRGRLRIVRPEETIAREIEGDPCDEVVSALALVTALAIDPRARTAATRPPPPPPSPPPPVPRALPPVPPPIAIGDRSPDLAAAPLPAAPARASEVAASRPWVAWARGAAAFAVTPRPLWGGGAGVERSLGGVAALRLGVEIGATGTFTVDPAAAWFLRAIARIEGCGFAARAGRLSLEPCLSLEGGILHGQGVASSAIPVARGATVPWFAVGLLPRAAIDLGRVVIEAQGGPALPIVRRTFEFDATATRAAITIHEVPAVTGLVSLGVGVHFP